MFARAILAFLVLPGVAAVIAPPLIASVDPWRGTAWAPGLVVMLAGAVVLLWCARDFYVLGKGTLAPWDPPKKLVTTGLYRFVRNPMYVGVLLLVLGWASYLSSAMLAAYMVVLAIGFHIRVLTYEEPWLKSQFGEEWETYTASVLRWLPRLLPRKDGF
jgi:protein-S-isoprenylcysteine O-methyltransferase Ste14